MAKHLGERARPQQPGLSRGLAWGLGALALVGVLTVVAVVRGVATHGRADLSVATSPTHEVRTPTPRRQVSKAQAQQQAQQRAQQQAQATATRQAEPPGTPFVPPWRRTT